MKIKLEGPQVSYMLELYDSVDKPYYHALRERLEDLCWRGGAVEFTEEEFSNVFHTRRSP